MEIEARWEQVCLNNMLGDSHNMQARVVAKGFKEKVEECKLQNLNKETILKTWVLIKNFEHKKLERWSLLDEHYWAEGIF